MTLADPTATRVANADETFTAVIGEGDADTVTVELPRDVAITVAAAAHVMAQGAVNETEGMTAARRQRLVEGRDAILAAAGAPPVKVVEKRSHIWRGDPVLCTGCGEPRNARTARGHCEGQTV